MSDFDLIGDVEEPVEDPPEIQQFISNLDGVDKLWRLTDLTAPHFFKLRPIDRGKISLVDILKDFIDANTEIELFDFSFCHIARNVRKWKIDNVKHLPQLIQANCLYLVVNEIIQRVRSERSFIEKISYISITPGQEDKPLSHHWDLAYSDPKYDQDKDLIELLMSCCELNPDFSIRSLEYLEYIYGLDLNTNFNAVVNS